MPAPAADGCVVGAVAVHVGALPREVLDPRHLARTRADRHHPHAQLTQVEACAKVAAVQPREPPSVVGQRQELKAHRVDEDAVGQRGAPHLTHVEGLELRQPFESQVGHGGDVGQVQRQVAQAARRGERLVLDAQQRVAVQLQVLEVA